MDDLRPPGTVEIKCSHPACDLYFWIPPDDPRLPDGPFDCGGTHEDDREAQLMALSPMYGFVWGSRGYEGPRSDGKECTTGCGFGGQRAGHVGFRDKWSRHGLLRYQDLSQLDDPRGIADLITWYPAGVDLDHDYEPAQPGTLPRMGGSYYSTDEGGRSVERKQVLHRCPRCKRLFTLDVDHPLAFQEPTCADSKWCDGYVNPCPLGETALQLDPALQAAHGPDTVWTMWDGKPGAKNLAEHYSKGRVLVRTLAEGQFKFALLHYEDPGEILKFVPHLRFGLLADLPLLPDQCYFSFDTRARRALPFVKPAN